MTSVRNASREVVYLVDYRGKERKLSGVDKFGTAYAYELNERHYKLGEISPFSSVIVLRPMAPT